ncbi:hypothetical protein SB717_36160, partial [Priestia sp. SIMBA_032]|uniref:hypothetical protein n=1 Tax=Priestia sp. SIMBA_032 TaxID=3085775 RepID=UPI0039796481
MPHAGRHPVGRADQGSSGRPRGSPPLSRGKADVFRDQSARKRSVQSHLWPREKECPPAGRIVRRDA